MTVQEILAPIETEMKLFEVRFHESMKSKVPLLDKITHYIIRRKGKQMRPMFLFLTAKMLGEIQKMLEEKTGKKISLESKVNPEIIGGMVIRMGDSLYDASIANKLKKIKKELVLN